MNNKFKRLVTSLLFILFLPLLSGCSNNQSEFYTNYKSWIITNIIIIAVSIIMFIIASLINCLDLSDLFDYYFWEDWIFCLSPFAVLLLISIINLLFNVDDYYNILITIAAAIITYVLFIVTQILIDLIYYVIDIKGDSEEDDISYQLITFSMLKEFSLEDLKEICRANNISGYSSLKKNEIINLIKDFIINGDQEGNEISKN